MQLISATCGLTNFYVNQVNRLTTLDMSNTTVDELVCNNLMGGVSMAAIANAAALSGSLNAQADSFANIAGGWNESKGLMRLDFLIADNAVHQEFMHVIGYVINNNHSDGLTSDAVFIPQFSWHSTETNVGTGSFGNEIQVKRSLSRRTDYMLSDGVSNIDVRTLRPSDLFESAMHVSGRSDIQARLEEEMNLNGMGVQLPGADNGLPVGMFEPIVTSAAADIGRVGVIASKRSNLNPSMYGMDVLSGALSVQSRTRGFSGDGLGDERSASLSEGPIGELGNATCAAANREPQILRDEFFSDMMNYMGNAQLRSFRGYSIQDLLNMYENFEQVLNTELFDSSRYPTIDFTQTAQSMGTSNLGEVVGQAIMFNLCDVMMRHGVSMLNLRGSNCDGYNHDGSTGNIAIIPSNVQTFEKDDWTRGQKAEEVINDLTCQIFTHLNGESGRHLTPIRFEIKAELQGNTQIDLVVVDETNVGTDFNSNNLMNGRLQWVYPTFAINSASCIAGSGDASLTAGTQLFDNIKQYFKC
jgi:hypothetical protein